MFPRPSQLAKPLVSGVVTFPPVTSRITSRPAKPLVDACEVAWWSWGESNHHPSDPVVPGQRLAALLRCGFLSDC